MKLERRPATEADVPFLIELRRQTMSEHQIAAGLTPSHEERERRVLARFEWAQVITCDGQPIGILKVEREEVDWVLHQIQIAPEFQGRGIGGQLIRELAREAGAAGVSVFLGVYRTNPARRLYERLGFEPTGEGGEHEIEMVLKPQP